MELNIKVILGTTRENRFGDKPARWVYEIAKKRSELEVEFIDLRDYPLPFFDSATLPSIRTEPYENEIARKWAAKVKEADGFIMVAPEYNHGYSAVLKNAIDYLYTEWNNKPVGFVSYGSVMGARVIEQLRLVAVELQMAPIRQSVNLPFSIVGPVIFKQGAFQPESFDESLRSAPDKMLDQLIWWAKALKAAREKDSE